MQNNWYNTIYPSAGNIYQTGDRVLITDLSCVKTVADHIQKTAGDADTEAVAQWLLVSDDPKKILASMPPPP